jgi:catechol 2,3-dioxygenase-like lactoylglutathione lyase family enzyme
MFVRVTLHASDLAASRRFYETVLQTLGTTGWEDFALAPAADDAFYDGVAGDAGLQRAANTPELVRFRDERGSFSLVAGEPSRNVHMTLPGPEAPPLRDPDGNVVELGQPRRGSP